MPTWVKPTLIVSIIILLIILIYLSLNFLFGNKLKKQKIEIDKLLNPNDLENLQTMEMNLLSRNQKETKDEENELDIIHHNIDELTSKYSNNLTRIQKKLNGKLGVFTYKLPFTYKSTKKIMEDYRVNAFKYEKLIIETNIYLHHLMLNDEIWNNIINTIKKQLLSLENDYYRVTKNYDTTSRFLETLKKEIDKELLKIENDYSKQQEIIPLKKSITDLTKKIKLYDFEIDWFVKIIETIKSEIDPKKERLSDALKIHGNLFESKKTQLENLQKQINKREQNILNFIKSENKIINKIMFEYLDYLGDWNKFYHSIEMETLANEYILNYEENILKLFNLLSSSENMIVSEIKKFKLSDREKMMSLISGFNRTTTPLINEYNAQKTNGYKKLFPSYFVDLLNKLIEKLDTYILKISNYSVNIGQIINETNRAKEGLTYLNNNILNIDKTFLKLTERNKFPFLNDYYELDDSSAPLFEYIDSKYYMFDEDIKEKIAINLKKSITMRNETSTVHYLQNLSGWLIVEISKIDSKKDNYGKDLKKIKVLYHEGKNKKVINESEKFVKKYK